MKTISVKVPQEIYDKLKTEADSRELTFSEHVRNRLIGDDNRHPRNDASLTEVLQTLKNELGIKNQLIDRLQTDLSDQSKRHDMIVAQMTTQVDHVYLQLEDLRKSQPWWKRVFGGTV